MIVGTWIYSLVVSIMVSITCKLCSIRGVRNLLYIYCNRLVTFKKAYYLCVLILCQFYINTFVASVIMLIYTHISLASMLFIFLPSVSKLGGYPCSFQHFSMVCPCILQWSQCNDCLLLAEFLNLESLYLISSALWAIQGLHYHVQECFDELTLGPIYHTP